MCGIAGIVQYRGRKPVSRQRLAAMVDALHHRGPDETGLYLDNRAGLGHARLSIIDLSSGTQPIHNEDQTLWITFNGEIFNYPELRKNLEARGHRFYTTTDTEVILHLYEEKGEACLDDLNGQFAFAIWNAEKQTCFLARDRFGIRPLYYTVLDGTLLFASEIKSIFTCPAVPREIDPVAMDQVFTFWAPLPGRTPFKNIRELPAGHCMVVDDGRLETRRYWQMPFRPKADQLDWAPRRIAEEIQARLKEAVRIRLRADVPVGTYLSGGLDSSGITALVARNFQKDVKTFGICFENAAFDEGIYQRRMAEFLGTDHVEQVMSNTQIGSALPDIVWFAEKPLLRTAPVPLFLLSKTVREHNLKVVLTGEGSDEVFGGYNIFREACVRRFWARFPDSEKRANLISHLYPYIFNDPRLKRMMLPFFAKGLDQTDDPLFSHLIRWGNTARIKGYFSDDLAAAVSGYDGLEEVREGLPAEFSEWDHLQQAQHLEMSIFMSCYLLSSQGDRTAMGHSVEVRMPYLDPDVLEFAGRIPANWKILGLKEKYLLKQSFRGTLPDDIALRPKHPYRAPIVESLFGGDNREATLALLNEAALREAGLFDPARVGRLIKKLIGGAHPGETDGMALTGIVTAQWLHERFIRNFPKNEPPGPEPGLVIDRRNEMN